MRLLATLFGNKRQQLKAKIEQLKKEIRKHASDSAAARKAGNSVLLVLHWIDPLRNNRATLHSHLQRLRSITPLFYRSGYPRSVRRHYEKTVLAMKRLEKNLQQEVRHA